jgi:hypothetical protein
MLIIRIAIALYLTIHGFSHLVGFVVPWKIASLKEEPYKTTLISGAIDVGDVGIRVIGLLWLATSITFFIAAWGSFSLLAWWKPLTLYLALFSLVLCVLGLPGAKIGIIANAVIIVYLLAGEKLGWIPTVAG